MLEIPPLNYSMRHLLKCAIALGASPLIIGTLIYFAWRLARWNWLALMGLMTILIGIFCFIAGALCLIIHLKREARASRFSPMNALLVGGLLIANFPVAILYAYSAIDISTRYTVRVYNDSNHTIDSFIILGPGVETELGPILSGQKAIQHNHITTDGSLSFTAKQQDVSFNSELEGYVSINHEGDMTVRIKEKGSFEIKDNLN